jgi:ABC-type dipeptide/oligopeptide/nickel transport system ATPase subunit
MAMPTQPIQEVDNNISSSAFEGRFDHHFSTKLGSDQMRRKVKEIFQEQIGSVNFSKTIKTYAAEEMDRRLFRSVQYWIIVVITAVVTGIISSSIALFVTKK